MIQIEQYDYLELREHIPFCGTFRSGEERITARAFDRGDGTYALRLMPQTTGVWEYTLENEAGEMLQPGSFLCTPAAAGNHGVVHADGGDFRYSDGTLFRPFGTTSYAWIQEPEEVVQETIASLRAAPFNKIRMCVFPKYYPPHCLAEPFCFPFERDGEGNWRIDAPVTEFWDRLDRCLLALRALGIEADLILFHPYDKWGFASLTPAECDAYLDYCLRRYGAFRNIWWSLANEYDLCFDRTPEDWERFGSFLAAGDYADHLRSVHNFMPLYDFTKDWVTHCSIQSSEVELVGYWKKKYQKPVSMDEIQYEGDEPHFGDITAETLVDRCWQICIRGGWPTHGETYQRPDDRLWWARGGELRGESPARIAFMRRFFESLPGNPEPVSLSGKNAEQTESPMAKLVMQTMSSLSGEEQARKMSVFSSVSCVGDEVFLQYLGRHRPARVELHLPEDGSCRVELIDAWNMTRETVLTGVNGRVEVPMPSREFIAVAAFRE